MKFSQIVSILLFLPGCGQSLDGFLFNPQALDSYEPSLVIPPELQEMVTFQSDNFNLAGFYISNPAGSHQDTTILYSHGNARNIPVYWDRVELMWNMGYTVFVYDYRGYGLSEGTPTEEGLYADVQAAYEYVLSREETDPDRIIAYGFSLGTIATVDLAWRGFPLAGIITESGFASGRKFVQDSSRLNVGGGWLMDGTWDSETKIREVEIPKLLMHGTMDDFVNVTHLDVLAAAAADPKVVWYVEGANHSDVPWIGGLEYVNRVDTFIESVMP